MSTKHTPPLHAIETRPAELFAPGEFITEELEARKWTVDGLAARVASRRHPLTAAQIQAIIDGGPLNNMAAYQIARAFGTTPEFWMNLEAIYRYWLNRS